MPRFSKKYKRKCRTCKKIFFISKWQVMQNRGKYCSKTCFPLSKMFKKGRKFWKGKHFSLEHRRKLSKIRLAKNLSREKHWNWKGGIWHLSKGYILILKPDHPFANTRGYILAHRHVMEQKLQRFLKPYEVIHHINGKKDDNRIENLKLFKNIAHHTRYHGKAPSSFKKGS